MNKKAFTLIELLAVIVVLGVIALLIFPNVDKTINETKEKSYARQISILEQAAKKYMKDNLNELPTDSCCVTIETLINSGYISAKDKDSTGNYVVINPITNEPLTGSIDVIYDEDYKQYEYNYSENCSSYCGE